VQTCTYFADNFDHVDILDQNNKAYGYGLINPEITQNIKKKKNQVCKNNPINTTCTKYTMSHLPMDNEDVSLTSNLVHIAK
jgi:hypothetical protein